MKHFAKEMHILLEDNHLLALVKPANLLTQPDQSHNPSLQDWAYIYLQKQKGKKNVFIHPIHRLDKVTSGIVLFAKSSKALSRLNKQQRENKIVKVYYALVEGIMKKKESTIAHTISHGDKKAFLDKDGKKCSLFYKVLQEKNNQSLLEIYLQTGRYHQIRLQLSSIGHPILGDRKYGSTISKEDICLHHGKMTFFHPTTEEKISLSDFSRDFLQNLSF